MRTLAITQNITLDGSIEFLDNWFDPQARGLGDMADLQEEVQRQSAASDAMLLGRQTFEDFRSYWPHREDDTTGTSAYLDGVAKYVVSSTLTEPGGRTPRSSPATRSRRSPPSSRPTGDDIVLTGSITLGHALLDAGLVDEVRLFTYPVVQGRGRRLFPDGYQVDRLRLLGTRSFASGIVLTTYAV